MAYGLEILGTVGAQLDAGMRVIRCRLSFGKAARLTHSTTC
jgi:hypothetical protein